MSSIQNITAFVYDRKGKLLSVGRNSYVKTHPLQARAAKRVGLEEKIFLHAEVDALVRVKDWSKVYRMDIVRIDRNGKPAIAKPCPVCQHVIKLAGVNRVSHT